jgi:hypothetical protein
VQRATGMPSRLSCAQIFGAPYTPKFSACTRAMWAFRASSRTVRADGARPFTDQYVDGANCSAPQIGSTPKRSR